MRKKKNIYIVQYEKLSSFLNGLNKKDSANFENGNFEIEFKLVSKKELRKKTKSQLSNFDGDTLQLIIDELNQFKTREEGLNYLISKCSLRTDFEAVAKKMDVPFQKKDSIERLKDKIIESSIGYKIRSRAIQGNQENSSK